MSFIGVVSDSKCFDIIKEKIKENDQLKDIKVIQKGEPIFMRLNVEEEVKYLKDAMKKA